MTKTTNGGFWCGKLRYEISGTPAIKVCKHLPQIPSEHYLTYDIHRRSVTAWNARRSSGSAFTTNVLVPLANFGMVSGTPKLYGGAHQSGMTLTIHFCGDCGSTIYKTGTLEIFDGFAIVQGGTLDEGLVMPHQVWSSL